jgi:hypothetical protein
MDEFPHSSPDILQRAVQAASGQMQDAGTTADTKLSKDEVNYRPAGSSNTRCERCVHFSWNKGSTGQGSCRIVAGLIKGDYVCDRFQSGGAGLTDLIENKPTR